MPVIINEIYNILVIETDSYAGNFELEIGNFIIGCGCDVAYKNSDGDDMFDTLDEYLESVTDEHGEWVVSSMLESENSTYNNIGIFFAPEVDISKFKYLQTFKNRAKKFARKHDFKILGFKIVEVHPVMLTTNISGKNPQINIDNKRIRGMMVAQ